MEQKAINDSILEDMIYFSLKESVEFCKKNKEEIIKLGKEINRDSKKDDGMDYALKIEEELKKKYSLSDKLVATIQRPVFWYLSSEKLIPSNGRGLWLISEEAEKLTNEDLKKITEKIFKEYEVYIKSNFENEKYRIN